MKTEKTLTPTYLAIRGFLVLVLVALGLAACQGDDGGDDLADALPLDNLRPTFVFFYTDG